MTWFRESKRSFLESTCIQILKTGHVPRHVAFIMDGNRRYANNKNMEVFQGHVHGFDKLSECLEWCQNLGIKEVTVYAFSIENFKRSQKEVDDLMSLIEEKVNLLLDEKEKLKKHEVCIRVLGDLSLLPVRIQSLVAKVIQETQNYTKAVLNICISYTSREEISTAVKDMVNGVKSKTIVQSDISEGLLERCLYTAQHPTLEANPVDLLIRTSGEVRLSDFLLWQTSYAVLSFHEILWPEFSIWNLFAAIIYYQRNSTKTKKKFKEHEDGMAKIQKENDMQEIRNALDQGHDYVVSQAELEQFNARREKRISRFVNDLREWRKKNINDLLEGRTVQKSIIPFLK